MTTGSMTTTPAAGQPYNITINLKNTNGVPPYISWKIVYEWWNGTTLLQRDTAADLKGFRSTTDVAYSSNITLNTVPAGTNYSLHVKVVDPLNYRIPMPLFNTGRMADGSYLVRGGITVTSNSGGAVANAGPNQTTTGSSVTLTSAASQGAATQAWTRVSGPNTPTITTPTAVSTTVTGLITGTYVFQVCTNGGPCSGQLISQVTIMVNPVPAQANAGNNQTITLPTSTVTLDGSGSLGLTSNVWTNVSGPNTPSITNPNAVSTTVNGLIAGTYVFQLSINSGASTDQMTVTVLPAAAPVANAGASQTITLPTSSVTVSGAGSSGTITSYLWTRISGPNNPVFGSSSSVSTTLSGLIQGVYVIQLSLNGGASTDTMQITVNPALPPPSINGTTVFTTQTPNSGTLNDGPQSGITGIELGMKFRSTVAGYVTGVRFYKTQGNTGTHTVELYNSSGTRLSSTTLVNETNIGWQTGQFAIPIPIAANTTYVVAYFSSSGNYVSSNNYFTTGVVNSPLTGLAQGTDGNNGLYKYTATAAFPNATFQLANYWVDPIFSLTNPGNLPGHLHHSIYFQAR